ncbi:hypothetical protein [Desulfosediminicola ganghwensis]|uniref:hypothetical protein n=1 Tax=Desulfosediminicola ganghwensis TaxID=2569540 RepID=UPI0010AD4BB6|nr:hypothetical protein [Desulfosediminicola ganghwensis]
MIEQINKLSDNVDDKFLKIIELSKEEEQNLSSLVNDISEIEAQYSLSNDSQQKQNLTNDLNSKYECLNSLKQEILNRKNIRDNNK